jgi:hypothetical protein
MAARAAAVLQRSTPWVWLWCYCCHHRAPFACAVAVIRWGADVSSDRLRQCTRCTGCGSKGATLQHPSWGGNSVGFMPFPDRVAVTGDTGVLIKAKAPGQ